MTIFRGGQLQTVSSSNFDSVIKANSGEYRMINIYGKITIGDGSSVNGDGFYSFATTGPSFVFRDASVFEWNSTSSFGPISNATYFLPLGYHTGESPDTVFYGYPILRLTKMPPGTFGGSDSTVINGTLEVNTPVMMSGSGSKTFRDGIKGSSSLTQSAGSGKFKTQTLIQSSLKLIQLEP